MNYEELAMKILEYVGGKENVADLIHCATRLRFNLIDRSKARTKDIEALPEVSGVVTNAGQYQIVIGTDVPSVYRPISKMLEEKKNGDARKKQKGNLKEKFIDTVSGIFSPTLPALAASGMLKVVLSILLSLNVIDQQNSTYQVINFMADATFYFYPILIANSAAKKFGCNQVLAMMLGGILLHPNFISMVTASQETGQAITVFGLPIYNTTYSNSVIPIILGVWFMSYVEPIADKISPKAVKFFTRPLITMLVTGIATLCLLGPLGSMLSTIMGEGIKKIDTIVPWLVPMIMGGIQPLTIITGTGGGFFTIAINNRLTIGYDSMFYPGWLASNIAVGAATLAFSVRTKNKELKQLAASSGFTAVCGITEPALFGVNINHMTNMAASLIGGAVGGFFMGLLNVKNFFGGSPGLLTLPSYMSPDWPMSNLFWACVGSAIAFAVSFAISFIFYKPSKDEQEKSSLEDATVTKNHSVIKLFAPVNGKSIPLQEVNDSTFANEIVGKGVAIIPNEGKLYSPVNGKVYSVFPDKHAISIISDDGVEVMLHIGLDTVKLKGKYFDIKVKDGQNIEQGNLLAEFDLDKIKEEGYDPITIMIVTNTNNYQTINSFYKDVHVNDELVEIM